MLSAVSVTATGSTWDPATERAVWFLERFGGWWGRADAQELRADLDAIDARSRAISRWIVRAPKEEQQAELAAISRADWVLEVTPATDGEVAVISGALHVGVRHAPVTRCGLQPQALGMPGEPVAYPRRRPEPWCVTCAESLARSYVPSGVGLVDVSDR